MKKKVYIISHSHWDREWYMAYEQHHMRLIDLIDDLLDLIKSDPHFNSFHLDGQTIILDDYLQVRPENKDALKKAIKSGKLRIGPFYILQDAFLTSPESNTRNMLIGFKESNKWGQPTPLGYFPDTFGNIGQTPQMMKLADLDVAAFGRGVKPIGFDNQVLADDNYTSQYSEMFWNGPDGTQILGLLFANWYSNGNEIPATKKEAKIFWDKKLREAEKYASTNHLLMMNGVDHQPVQKDITQAIALANELYPEYEFIHSNFTDYLAAVKADLPKNLGAVTGELTSQETDGWFTLANTASTRVYLKQWNTRVSRQLETIAEPLAAMAYEVTGQYPADQLEYAWKTLMKNHPHDSICGCSVDEVHREMLPRFEKAFEVGKYLAQKAVKQLTNAMDTMNFPKESRPFVVFNTTGSTKSGVAQIDIILQRIPFSELAPTEAYQRLAAIPHEDFHVINREGQTIPATIHENNVRFNYELPTDAFRKPYMEKSVTVLMEVADLPAFSWETFALMPGENKTTTQQLVKDDGRTLENDFVKVHVEKDGSLTIFDKKLKRKLDQQLVFEDMGDIANEYIFKSPAGDQALLSTQFPHKIEIVENSAIQGKIRLTHFMKIPKSADELLNYEQQSMVDFRYRKAQRSPDLISYPVSTIITLNRLSNHVHFETTVNNQATDHRLRVLFPTKLAVATHEADSIYEVVTRNNQVSSYWKNPTNPQHQQAFVNLHNQEFGVTINNFGLNEYEVVNDTLALTLLRCVGELGDWSYLPTPEAQCLGTQTFHYGIMFHGKPETRYHTYQQAHAAQTVFITSQAARQTGSLPNYKNYLKIGHPEFAVTALKRGAENELIVRGYNLTDHKLKMPLIKNTHQQLTTLNLLEEPIADYDEVIQPYEIRTIKIADT